MDKKVMRKQSMSPNKTPRRLQVLREESNSYRVASRFYWLPVTKKKIRQAAQKIVDATHPEKVILFGSYAYGKPNDDSDVDLFIVMKSNLSIHARTVELSEVLMPRPFPVDILTRTPAELKKRLELGDCFFNEIMTKGKVLYDRTAR